MNTTRIAWAFGLGALLASVTQVASAHCDTMNGPVVTTAQKALETGNLNPTLAWVKPAGEAEVRAAFAHALKVRKLGPEAQALADRYFLETVVRVHRAGEGEPFTGLKEAGEVEPPIRAADEAIKSGNLAPVTKLVTETVEAGLKARFARLLKLKAPADNVAEGREWVEAYVGFVHYVEHVHMLASGEGAEHGGSHEAHGEHED